MSVPMSKRQRIVLAVALVVAVALSLLKYQIEAYPQKVWRNEPAKPSAEVCPDGMDLQIELFAAWFRGEPDAGPRLHAFLTSTYESSTYLVGVVGGALNCAGVPAPRAFQLLSIAASLLLVLLAAQWLAQLVPERPGVRLAALLVFLFHPAAIRCLARPQTDALYALAVVAAFHWGDRLTRGDAVSGRATLAQSAALFVKIHVAPLLLIPPTVAFCGGVRGRRLAAIGVATFLVPLAIWAALFAAFDLFPTIAAIWGFIDRLFQDWTAGRVVRIVLLTHGPLLVLALAHRKLLRAPALPIVLFLAGYAALLYVTEKPPLMRFTYPLVLPLVALGASAIDRRPRLARFGGLCFAPAIVWQAVLLGIGGWVAFHLRYVGNQKQIEGLAHFIYDFI